MAGINLRDYLQGLEELIEGGHAEDALAHCRHILKTYSKHVDTYRLMGKAYLELKRHSEASDIFQRVLSSAPDDFVAHIGMSIIREDEGNQDAAIWHMERAFEAQPSNRAVQDELRRLYGKREGYEPPKVRLTRGALARMYAHGDLYNQAIGELRGALAEDSQRPDLQVLLAEMYFNTNRQAEAIEVCSKLIEKLPYCLLANRIMVDILRAGRREVEAKPYLERVEELDPYAAQVSLSTPLDEVAADSVILDQLVLESQSATPVAPPKAWTASLQLPEEEKYEKENLPDWLSLDNLEEKLPPAEEQVEQKPKRDTSVLKSLYGLDPSPADAAPPAQVEPEAEAIEETEQPATPAFTSISKSTALKADNIPDWLRELRPATGSISLDEPKQPAAEEEPAIEEPRAQEAEAVQAAKVEKPARPTFEESFTAAPVENVETPAISAEDEENLSWLEGLAAKQGAAEEELLTAPEKREEAAPEWLEKEKPKSDALSWLDELASESDAAVAAADTTVEPTPSAEELDSPFAEQLAEDADTKPEPVKSDTTPVWLKELSAEVEQSAQTGEEPIAPRPLDEAPDWLSELRPDLAAEDEPAEEVEEEKWDAEDDLGKLDWLEKLGPAGGEQTPIAKPVESAWVPEAELATNATQAENIHAAPVAPAAPPMSPRKTASLLTAQLAPGKLEMARQALNYGKLNDAADHYGYLLRRRVMLDEIIADLSAALRRHPQEVTLWQTLGDAYMRNNQLREALDCYTKAEDLL